MRFIITLKIQKRTKMDFKHEQIGDVIKYAKEFHLSKNRDYFIDAYFKGESIVLVVNHQPMLLLESDRKIDRRVVERQIEISVRSSQRRTKPDPFSDLETNLKRV